MSLIITEFNAFGLTMTADTAVSQSGISPSNLRYVQVLNGFKKLHYIQSLNAGISMWGQAQIGGCPVDKWVSDFVGSRPNLTTMSSFADELANELGIVVGNTGGPLGFHIAGYGPLAGGGNEWQFYHVRNVDGPYGQYTTIPFAPDLQFNQRTLPNGFNTVRNGDFGAYAVMVNAVEQSIPRVRQISGLNISASSLGARLQWHTAWTRFISDITFASTGYRTIGAEVLSLAFDPSGRVVHQNL